MRALIVALFVLIAGPVHAGSLSFQIVATAGTVTKTYTISDTDVQRIVNAYQAGANSGVNGTATRNQVLQFWITGFIAETTAAVNTSEQNAAVQALPPIVPVNPQ